MVIVDSFENILTSNVGINNKGRGMIQKRLYMHMQVIVIVVGVLGVRVAAIVV